MIICGIDPGKTGALAITYPDGEVHFFDVPTAKTKGKVVPAWSAWEAGWGMALDFAGVGLIVIEDIAARPGQGVTSMFSFGRTLGFAHGIALGATSRPSIQFVSPSTWKAKLGLLNSDKGASREKCRNLYPSTAAALARVKDDGRAEAALIAHYGRKFL